MDIIEFLKKESRKFEEGRKLVAKRRNAWAVFEHRATTMFNSLCVEARTQKLFEFLYVDSTEGRRSENPYLPPYVTLFWGQHPTGNIEVANGQIRLNTEGGCALHFCQSISGQVVVIYYPFSSELMKTNEKF